MAAFINFVPPCTSRTTKVTSALTYAVLEWLLIVLLLFNSFLSYVIVKFASSFDLQRPCLWCSRVDHLFEAKKMINFYRILVCDSHAQEISSLSYCSSHQKLCISQSLCCNCRSDYAPSKIYEHTACSCCNSPFENNSAVSSGTDKFLEMKADSIFPRKFSVAESELEVRKEEDDVLEIKRVSLPQNSPEEHGFGRDDSKDEKKQKDVKIYVTDDDLHHITSIVAKAEGFERNLTKDEHKDYMIFVEARDGNKEIEFVIGSCSSSDAGEEQESNASAIELLKFDLHDKQLSLITDVKIHDHHEEEVDFNTHIDSFKNGEIYPDDHRKDTTTTTMRRCVNGGEESFSYNGGNGRDVGGVGVPTVEQLKAALLVEREALDALCIELEEERNASAVAASHTMAMINRLQGEKAAMKMEALQYQRIMEEQFEYDLEALQLLNELMVKKEKERHDLEKELDLYRKRVVDYEDDLSIKESLDDFEEERFSIVELRILERKLFDLKEEGGASCENCGVFEFQLDVNGEKLIFPLFEEEVDSLYERLEALEGEMEFLVQCIGSMKKGEKGMGVVHEILHHLRLLKNLEMHRSRNVAEVEL